MIKTEKYMRIIISLKGYLYQSTNDVKYEFANQMKNDNNLHKNDVCLTIDSR